MKHDITEILKRLFAFLETFVELNDEFRDYIAAHITPWYFAEDKTLFNINDKITITYFISTGYMTCSEFCMGSDDQVVEIFAGGQVVAPPSFHDNEPSKHDLKVLSGTFVLFLTYDQMQEIYKRFSFTQELAKLILNFYKKQDLDRLRMIRKSGIQSVYDFYIRYPDLLIKSGAALKDPIVASFLIMDERTLRRNRSKLIKTEKLKYLGY
jgi:signal-transduction protein with cAMP-binding, CBS, and nucleotidyltransferase domain